MRDAPRSELSFFSECISRLEAAGDEIPDNAPAAKVRIKKKAERVRGEGGGCDMRDGKRSGRREDEKVSFSLVPFRTLSRNRSEAA